MYRSSPARKFGPIALLIAAQLAVVLVAPSTARLATTASAVNGDAGDSYVDGGSAADPGAADAATAADAAATTTAAGPGGATTAAGSGGSGSSAASGGATAAGPAAGGGVSAADAGDTTHCVGGREFDPAVEYFAPPCVPGKPGLPYTNPGATSQGVTKDKITIVQYVPDYGAEVDAVLQAQGLYYNADNAKKANAAFQKFINGHYQLYGRQIDIQTFQGTCATVPPNPKCLIPEMDRIADQYKPYAVFFQTTVCSQCFAELARKKVVTFGGAGFSDEFRDALRPYNYDYGMSSTTVSKLFAQWWCGSMKGKNAVYAGSENAAQDFRKTKRSLGVVSTNDPDNERVIKNVLYPELAKCGESVNGHEYFYAQDINTATQQSQAGTAKMNTPQNPATSVVCFCDPVAPQFSYNAATNNNYWPETLFATNQAMDTDSTGQTYEGSVACPQSNRGCAFDGALGLGTSEKALAPDALGSTKVWKAAGSGDEPLQPLVMEIFWQNYNMLASLIQAAGPTLNPAQMAAAAPKLGSRGGGTSGFSRRAFENGHLSWVQDMAVTYWNKNKTSPYNGAKGAFTQAYGGKRFGLGQLPGGDPAVPTVDQRG